MYNKRHQEQRRIHMKNVLITGCNGYIGNAIVQRLLNKGYNVTGIDNNSKIR